MIIFADMKARIIHLYEIIAGAILSILGFGACTSDQDSNSKMEEKYRQNLCEYGTETATYVVKGTVKSEETGEAIPGIKTTYRQYMYTDKDGIDHYFTRDTVTDDNGNAVIRYGEDPFLEEDYIEVILEDVDGPDNGGFFAADTLRKDRLTINQTKEGDGNWYVGEFTIGFDAALKKANPEE